MPDGSTAISPSMCLDLHFPTFRMYHKTIKHDNHLAVGKRDKSELKVEVVYLNIEKPKWEKMAKFKGKDGVSAPGDYMLSEPIDLKPEIGGNLPGARQAALRFTVEDDEDGESILLDDVYVDPMRR